MLKELSQVRRFSGMNHKSLKCLADHSIKLILARNSFAFREGDPSDHLYVVQKGSVKLFKFLSSGRELTLNIFYPGESIAEGYLVEELPFPANAIALENSTLIKVDKTAYFALFNSFPDSALSVIHALSHRIIEQNRRVKELGSGEVEKRLAEVLLSIGERTHSTKGRYILTSLSRHELASLVGARLETVIRLIGHWYKKGVAEKSDRGLKLKKQELLSILEMQ
jgi:CRP/FNR family transcriptional regulator